MPFLWLLREEIPRTSPVIRRKQNENLVKDMARKRVGGLLMKFHRSLNCKAQALTLFPGSGVNAPLNQAGPLAQERPLRHQLLVNGRIYRKGGGLAMEEKREGLERMDSGREGVVRPIESDTDVEALVEHGFQIKGPRGEPSKDLVSFQRILKTGRVFIPETWLVAQEYQAVEPSPFTQGKKILWKEKDNFPDEYASSNYTLIRGEEEIPLYLKVELPDLGG
jgi:hypothetical protein